MRDDFSTIQSGFAGMSRYGMRAAKLAILGLFAACAPQVTATPPIHINQRNPSLFTSIYNAGAKGAGYGMSATGSAYSCPSFSGSCTSSPATVQGRLLYSFKTGRLQVREMKRSAHASFSSCILEPYPRTQCSASTTIRGTLGRYESSIATTINESGAQDWSQFLYAAADMESVDTVRVTSSTLPAGTSVQIENVLSGSTEGMLCVDSLYKNAYGGYELRSAIYADGTSLAGSDYFDYCSADEGPMVFQTEPSIVSVAVGQTYRIADWSFIQDAVFTDVPSVDSWSDALNDITAVDRWTAVTPGVTLRFASGGADF